MSSTSVFISYAWESDDHVAWVTALADELEREDDIHVVFDQYDLHAGKDITHFMDSALRSARIVVVVTPLYVHKAQGRMGGVGYESSVISADLLADQLAARFIPILRAGDNLPPFLRSKHYVDFRIDSRFDASVSELLNAIRGVPKRSRPPKAPRLKATPPLTASLVAVPLRNPVSNVPPDKARLLKDRRDLVLQVAQSQRDRVSPGVAAVRKAWADRDALFVDVRTLAISVSGRIGVDIDVDITQNECAIRAARQCVTLLWTHRYIDELQQASLYVVESTVSALGALEELRRTRFAVALSHGQVTWVSAETGAIERDALAEWTLVRLADNLTI